MDANRHGARTEGRHGVRCAAARSLGAGVRELILRAGDRVAIIEPAASAAAEDAELLDQARGLLEEWGLAVVPPRPKHPHFYLAGTDEERAEEVRAALADRETRAIFCARGGYGVTRLFPFLRAEWGRGPKLLVGFSDITALHLAARKLWPAVQSWHAPNMASRRVLGTEETAGSNRRSMRDALFRADYEADLPIAMLREGAAAGLLIGGCLTLIVSALGSRFAIETHGRILFLEDTKEAPYRIDRMLVALRNAGLFEGLAGLVFGEMATCEDEKIDLRAVIMDVLRNTPFPVGYGLAVGHGETNVPLPLGGWAVLDGKGRFRARAKCEKLKP